MIADFKAYCLTLLSYCFVLISFYRNDMDIYLQPMDEMEISSCSEEVVKTMKKTNKKSKKHNPKWYLHLLYCLDEGKHSHMLKYVPGSNREIFEVIFIDKKNKKKWKKSDISLFVELDNHISEAFNRKRPSEKSEENVKTRFKSNLSKCVKQGFVEEIGMEKTERYKTVKNYKILMRFPVLVGEQGNKNEGKNGKLKGKPYKKGYKKDEIKEAGVQEVLNGNVSPVANDEKKHNESFPQISSNESFPQISSNESFPQISSNESFPQISSNESFPQISSNESFPQISSNESFPQIRNNESFPQISNYESVPQLTYREINGNFKNIPQVAENGNINLEVLCKEDDFNYEINEIIPVNGFIYSMNLPQHRENKMEDIDSAIPYLFQEEHENDSHCLCLLPNSQFGGLEDHESQNISKGKYIMDDICQEETECITVWRYPFLDCGALDPDFSDIGPCDEWPSTYQQLENMKND